MTGWLHRIDSPLGPIQAAFSEGGGLTYLGFADHEPRTRLLDTLRGRRETLSRDPLACRTLASELADHFAGVRRVFTVPLDLRGTAFQLRVWEELLQIPYGQTLSYGELAVRLGDPKLARAVGAANGMNPVSILVPCHRVIGGHGTLTGYAGGLDRKRKLLDLELSGA